MKQIEIENQIHLPSNNTKTLGRFSIDQLVKLIDKNMLLSIENIYQLRQDGFNILQFTRFFMNCIEHSEVESPYLAAGLGQFFQAISNGYSKVKFSQFTDFICQYIVEEDRAFKQLQAKWIPIKGHNQQKLTYLKDPPLLKGHLLEIYKVSLDKQNIDNSKHQNIISRACYSENNKNMYCLESLADWIGVYTTSSKLQKIIKPSALRAKKDLVVISICFSEIEERLGAVLKDFSISFWDVSDKFTFQKSINTTKYCQQLQNNIWYLQFFQKWLTSDIEGKIFIWNLPNEMPTKILQCVNKSKITDICEVPSIRLIAVAQEQKGNHTQTAKIQLISLQKGEIVTQIDTKIERRMLHTLRYSQDYQILLTAGYQKKISLFQINNSFVDSSLRGELLGHQSVITTFTLIKKTPMVVSADDRGKVKIWNIRNFKCVQTIDFSDKVSITNILDMANQKKICLMGSRIILLNLQKTPQIIQDVVPLKAKYFRNELLITTCQDFRKIDFITGKLKVIDCSYNKSVTDITFITMLSHGEVVTGNQKGEINFYCKNTDSLLQTGHWHSGSIQFIQEDFLNHQLLTYSDHSGFIILGREHSSWEHFRELKCNFAGKQTTSIALSPYHQLIAFIHCQTVHICDYQTLRIQYQFYFQDQEPTAVSFINGLGIILISSSQGRIYVYQIDKDQLTYKLQIECSHNYINYITSDLKCRELQNKTNVKSCQISCSFENGTLCIIEFAEYAKKINIKSSKVKPIECNHNKQIRESFQNQIKKHIFKEIYPHKQQMIKFQGKIHFLEGHKQGVTSLHVVQFDQPLLVSTGNDKRVKLWKDQELIGDLNINLPLPYLWKLENISQTKTTKRILQGLELIQILFKRYGKDISLGQAQIFKLTSAADNYFDKVHQLKSSKQYLKKKPTLFQQEFTEIDLNYDIIKKEKILRLGGLSLKKMELTQKIENLQQDWYISKQAEQVGKNSLLKTIIAKQQKNDEKQKIALYLKGNYSSFKDKEKENNSVVKKLQQKLEAAIQIKIPQKNQMKVSGLSKAAKDQYLKFSVMKQNVYRKSSSKQTLESYFTQKYKNNSQMCQKNSGFRQTRGQIRNSEIIRQTKQNSFHHQNKKDGSFRIILKELKQKLSRSKKGDGQRMAQSSYFTKRHYQNDLLVANRQIVNELDNNIHSFTTK